jgi:hypothetical protein
VSGREAIAPQLGGGFIVTGECGRPHLNGPAWSWWQCKPCKRAQAAATLRAVEAIRLALYYPEIPPAAICGAPTFTASDARHRRSGESCPVCRQGARDERRSRRSRELRREVAMQSAG